MCLCGLLVCEHFSKVFFSILFLIGLTTNSLAEDIFLNRAVLDYLETEPLGIDRAVFIVRNLASAFTSNDEIVQKILTLAASS